MAAFTSNIDITSGGTYNMNITNGEPASQVATDLNGKFANIQRYLQNGLPEVWTGESLPDSLPKDKLIYYQNKWYDSNKNPLVNKSDIDNLSTAYTMIYSKFQNTSLDTTINIDLSSRHKIIFYIDGLSDSSPYWTYNFDIGAANVLSYGSYDAYTDAYYHVYTIINNHVCRLYAPSSEPPSTAYYAANYVLNQNTIRVLVNGSASSYYTIKIYVA